MQNLLKKIDKSGLSVREVLVLDVAARSNNVSVREIADAIDVPRPSVTRLVDALVEAELLTRKRGSEDRRLVQIAVTASAKKLLRSMEGLVA